MVGVVYIQPDQLFNKHFTISPTSSYSKLFPCESCPTIFFKEPQHHTAKLCQHPTIFNIWPLSQDCTLSG